MQPYVCLACRRTNRRAGDADRLTCPLCGGPAWRYDPRFRAPRKADDAGWRKVVFLHRHGFRFQKVYDKHGDMWVRVRYPATLREAGDFVRRYADQALPTGSQDG